MLDAFIRKVRTKFYKKTPTIFSVEVNVSCNLRCPECPFGAGLIEREKGALTIDEFKVIADKVRRYSRYMYIMIWGEPLLNKDILEMIKYASKFTKTSISTNAMLLDSGLAEDLVLSGLNELIVSVDGFTQEVYEKYRVGGNVDQVLTSLKLLSEINKKYGYRLNIKPQFIVFRHNQHEMDRFKRYCNSLALKPVFKAPYIQKGSNFESSNIRQYCRKTYKTKKHLSHEMLNCQDVRKVFTILLDGSVVACCYDYNGVTTFGNIFKQEVLDIWTSEKYVDFRRAVIGGKVPGFCLNNCLEYRLDHDRDR